ncbi:zinc ribbon domain-containing protein [Acidicapsa dinghuensis]|uniref:Zinc ribbon domain-containing protein n=1 Tax=Acidicapsa dinghuensis TaxID=2218256 RepID=A0ABW1EEZ7_9BACT|nr:zinc ribbon domain-containing protein [Acidicapsa dinghuensis]
MPLYEYRCTSCGNTFEKIQSFSAEPERVCPKCGGELVRPMTAPALRFEGAGWYVNDYAGKGGAKPADAASSADGGKSSASEAKPTAVESAPAATSAPASSTPAGSTPASTKNSTNGS